MDTTTRDKLLQNGFHLIRKNGYNATGIKEITDSINVSKGSFYNHFNKKEKYIVELLDNYGRQLVSEHQIALSNKNIKPLQRIENFYNEKIENVIHKERFLKGCLMSNMCQEEADKSDLIAQSIDITFDGIQQALINCLDEAKKIGSISAITNTEQLAEFILNSWNGTLMRVKASRNSKAFDAFRSYIQKLKK
jgi:TetR/AcrR family transcriptional repressor of nem operon